MFRHIEEPKKDRGAARTTSCGVTNENTHGLDGTRIRQTTGQSGIHTADLGVTTPPPFRKVSHQLCSNYIIVLETAVSRLGLHFTTKSLMLNRWLNMKHGCLRKNIEKMENVIQCNFIWILLGLWYINTSWESLPLLKYEPGHEITNNVAC